MLGGERVIGVHNGETYEDMVERHKIKKTTDDCYTPPIVYDAVADWVADEFGLDKARFVRPFYPGGDFEAFEYPPDCVVVDNPPFSILARIQDFYLERGVKYFLFAPALTTFSSTSKRKGACAVCVGANITYDNGAKVSTSFVTNLYPVIKACSKPSLYAVVDEANKRNLSETTRTIPKYKFPDCVVTSANLQKFSKYGVLFDVPVSECVEVTRLDSQKEAKKAIYGKGLLLSDEKTAEKAAAEKAAAEKAAPIVWPLSDREREIKAKLGNKGAA